MAESIIDAFFDAEEGVTETTNTNRGRNYRRRQRFLKEVRHDYIGLKNCRYNVVNGVAVAVYYKKYGEFNRPGEKRRANKAVRRTAKTLKGLADGSGYKKVSESWNIRD